ncbi:MAG: hypothetical protein CM15mP26_3250 [Actinomycetota bacterium]|nr:MAG: hypothetical protein CM15mP26_3250 [Actinomycetota bacterium]
MKFLKLQIFILHEGPLVFKDGNRTLEKDYDDIQDKSFLFADRGFRHNENFV